MSYLPAFPTKLHQNAAESVRDYFLAIPQVDTVLVVNSCSSGQAVPESDVDFAILVSPETTTVEIDKINNEWLPYYAEELRIKRLKMAIKTCEYDLNHIPVFVKRGLYFQAFDILYKAFQEYLQVVFIAHKTYPKAYNKWIKFQFESLLNQPDLYPKLAPVLSVSNLESNEINDKAAMLRDLLNKI